MKNFIYGTAVILITFMTLYVISGGISSVRIVSIVNPGSFKGQNHFSYRDGLPSIINEWKASLPSDNESKDSDGNGNGEAGERGGLLFDDYNTGVNIYH